MYNRLYKFLKKTNLLNFSNLASDKNSHALTYLTELIKKQLDDGNYDCGIFIDLQRAFDTVDHDILPWGASGFYIMSFTVSNLYTLLVLYN